MKSLNKSLLAAAVVSLIALPSLTLAASWQYVGNKQITAAKDLIVNNNTAIETQNEFRLSADGVDTTRVATVTAGTRLTVKVTLTAGARFDTGVPATDFVARFREGPQTRHELLDAGGAPLPDVPVVIASGTTPVYSGNGQELNFVYVASADARLAPAYNGNTFANPYWLEMDTSKILNLVQGLFENSSIDAEITVQNTNGQQILAARQTIVRSKWGLEVRELAFPNLAKRIDVAADPRKNLFSPTGTVGASTATAGPGRFYFNAGGFDLDIASAPETNTATESYVNNYNALQANPQYNVVGTARITITVNGLDLSAFTGRAWLDRSVSCDTVASASAQRANLSITSGATDRATVTVSANHPLFKEVTDPSPSASRAYVCLAAGQGTTASPYREILPQPLSGSVSVDYDLPTQRVNPPDMPFALQALELNGTTLTFQNVNPAGNSTAESFLRLTNNNARECPVTIDAKDDLGRHSGEVQLTMAPHASEQLNINVLESGNDPRFINTNAGFRDGQGKWYVRVTAECVSFVGSALNRNSTTGVVTDLTPERGVPSYWLTPSVPVP